MECKECGIAIMEEEVCFSCRRRLAITLLKPTDILPKEVPTVISSKIRMECKKELSPSYNKHDSAFLYGPAGSGKSHEAAKRMLTLMRLEGPSSYQRFAWVNIPKLLFQIRQTFHKDAEETEQSIVEKYSTVDWLCLDDLGAEKTTDWSIQTLYLIINERYENEKATVITSNLSTQQLADKMEDDRLSSRICGMCECVHIIGRDRRLE